MIRHTVMWRLNATTAAEKARSFETIANTLDPLLGVIPGLMSLVVTQDLGDSDGNFDVVLVTEHESAAALEVYQSHPAHVAAGPIVKALVSERACVDSEV